MQRKANQKEVSVDVTQDDWDEIVETAALGDEEALQKLKRILRYHPEIRELLGDLSRHVQMVLIEIIGADSIATRESLTMQIDELRGELDRKNAGPLEQLLIEQVITTKLDLGVQQIGGMQRHDKETLRRRWERRMERAQKRHLAAVKALADFRKLLCRGELN